ESVDGRDCARIRADLSVVRPWRARDDAVRSRARPPQLAGEARRGKAIHWSISGISERSACFPYRIQSTEAMMNRIVRRLRATTGGADPGFAVTDSPPA